MEMEMEKLRRGGKSSRSRERWAFHQGRRKWSSLFKMVWHITHAHTHTHRVPYSSLYRYTGVPSCMLPFPCVFRFPSFAFLFDSCPPKNDMPMFSKKPSKYIICSKKRHTLCALHACPVYVYISLSCSFSSRCRQYVYNKYVLVGKAATAWLTCL